MNLARHSALAVPRGRACLTRMGRRVVIGLHGFALALGLTPPLAAQVVNFRHYTSAEGLPQAQVLAIHQDRHGYLWFASYGGLSRFNGGDFHTFTSDDGLTSNSVFDVVEDAQGRLLIATSGGLCIKEGDAFRCRSEAEGLVHENARTIALDRLGGAWVGTLRGLSYVRGDSIHNYTTADGLPDDNVLRVAVDSQGHVWVATMRGLARLVDGRFVPDSAPELLGRAAQFVVPVGDGVLVGSEGRLFRRRVGHIAPVVAAIPEGMTFVDGAVAPDGTIWLASRAGALRIHQGQVTQLAREAGLLSNLVNRVTIDREGNVWFGTENGASKHVPGPFRTYMEREGLPNPFVRAIAEDVDGRLWVGTRDGIAVRDGERFRRIPLPGLPDNRVYALAADPRGGLLIGTRRGLVSYRDGRVRVYRERDGLPGDVVYSLLADGRGGVWIGTYRGLAYWQRGRLTRITPPGLEGMSIIAMARDRRGRLWLGRTTGGIAVLAGDSLRLLGADEGATDQTVWSLAEDAQGRMWAGTNGDGALRIDDRGIRRFTVRDGLASNFVWQVLSDSRGDIWLFGNLGLDRLRGERLTHYGRGSGLIELEGAANSVHEDASGDLWFGTGSGVVRYTPGLDRPPAAAPPVYVESLTRDGQPVSLGVPGTPLRLKNGMLRLTFASPSFRDETAIRFRYRLVGADTAWSAPTRDRSITYAGLSPRRYRFEVVAEHDGMASTAPATLALTVLPAPWQTWWFRLGAAVLLVGGTAALPVLRARRLERERQRLEALVAQHTRALAEKNLQLEQSNRDLEHFAYVASHDLQEPLRKIQAFSDRVHRQYAERLDDRGRDYLSRMGSAAARMQKLIEALLTLSRVTTKKGPIEAVELGSLLQDVISDLEVRIQSTQGRVEIGALPCVAGDPVQLRQLFQNLVGNALKFHRADVTPVVRVHTTSGRDGATAEIRVEDNGIGFESAEAERIFLPFHRLHARSEYEGTGIGLAICQKIVERHGGTIRAQSAPGRGSCFVVTLPRRESTRNRTTPSSPGAQHAA